MSKWKVTMFIETSRGTLQTATAYAEELIDVSRILMTFNARKGAIIYKYEVELCETLV